MLALTHHGRVHVTHQRTGRLRALGEIRRPSEVVGRWGPEGSTGTSFLLQHQRLFDPVTGLPGPALLLDRVAMALARAGRTERLVGIVVLADVRAVPGEPSMPHALASVLRSAVRPDDTVARVHDHTFVVVCNDLRSEDHVELVARRLLEQAPVRCRVGVVAGTPSEHPHELLGRAFAASGGVHVSTIPSPRHDA
jgi:GGDEF domain-containing protein